jgi:hypothetical protein
MILCIVTPLRAETDGESRCERFSRIDASKDPINRPRFAFAPVRTRKLAEGTDDESPVVDRFCCIYSRRFDRMFAPQSSWRMCFRKMQHRFVLILLVLLQRQARRWLARKTRRWLLQKLRRSRGPYRLRSWSDWLAARWHELQQPLGTRLLGPRT